MVLYKTIKSVASRQNYDDNLPQKQKANQTYI
jgi:hypothetical protein